MGLWLKISDNWARIYFAISLFLLVFLLGVAVGVYKFFPYNFLRHAAMAIDDWRLNWKAYTVKPQARFLKKNEFNGDGVLIYDKDRAYQGITLYSGLLKDRLALYLIDMNGKLLHQWTVSFNELWPDANHLDSQPADLHLIIEGVKLFENGDVILVFNRAGIVRLDRCSNVVWKLPIRAHHLFNSSLTGGLWVPCEENGERQYAEKKDGPQTITLTLKDPESVCEISADGLLLRTIDPVAAFFRSGLAPLIMPSGLTEYESYHFSSNGNTFTHLNDVEVVTPKIADDFPMFKAGDLLLSLSTQNLLAVMAPDTETIKWTMRGPFFNQHDPDFLANGKILLFDNLGAMLDPNAEAGTRILEIDPSSGGVRTVYGSNSANFFYSETQGNQQVLENGNLLITESVRGRIFEIDPNGEVVWSFVIRWNDDEVVMTHQAIRYPSSYATFSTENCTE